LTLLLLGRDAEAAGDLEQTVRQRPDWQEHLNLLVRTANEHRQQGGKLD
jgi:hypothetical protein